MAYKKGHKPTKETLEKISKKLKGRSVWNKGKAWSEEVKKNISIGRIGKGKGLKQTPEWIAKRIMVGDKNPAWKGGITPILVKIRGSVEYKLWRASVFQRDNFACVFCGDKNYKGRGKTVVLQADHIKPFADYPELRFAIDNGRTLCFDCHKKTDNYGRPKKNG